MTLWLALRFPQLMIDALPDSPPAAVPLAIGEQQRLLAVNSCAAEFGIGAGMTVASALTLCDSLQIRPRQSAAEQRWLMQQARRLADFTPMICCEDDCLLLEIGASLRLFRGLDPLLTALQTQLQQMQSQQLPHRVAWQAGLALTPIAARVLSGPGLAACRACIVLNRQQSDRQPDLTASQSRLQALLASQPIADLPLEPALIDTLQGPGLRTLGDLFALPAAALRRRFGARFAQWLARLQGEQPDLRQPLIMPQRFSSTIAFDQPVIHTQQLQPAMQQLLKQMSDWLQRRQQQVRAIRWLLLPHQGQGTTLLVRRAAADHHADHWFDLCCRHLQQHRLRQPVLTLRLQSGRLLPMAAPPAHLFAALARPDASDLLAKLDNLPGLSLYRPAAIDSHLPEQNEYNADPLTDHAPPVSATTAGDMPLWLLETPLPLRNQAQQPSWRGAPLTLLPDARYCNEPWWQQGQQGRQRHYRIAHHPLGLCCWLFCYRDQPQQWFLHGFF